jgi:hypothetical protein
MSNENLVEIFLQPLSYGELGDLVKNNAECQRLLMLICDGDVSGISDIESRVDKLESFRQTLQYVPTGLEILTKLTWPIRNAIISYLLGNFLGTIAQCGMVAEMTTILIFEIAEKSIGNEPMNEAQQIKIFGTQFEKLGQERRIGVLKAFKLIDDNVERLFNSIKNTRRQYLHFYSKSHDKLPDDANLIIRNTLEILSIVIGQGIQDGRLIINPSLIKKINSNK